MREVDEELAAEVAEALVPHFHLFGCAGEVDNPPDQMVGLCGRPFRAHRQDMNSELCRECEDRYEGGAYQKRRGPG